MEAAPLANLADFRPVWHTSAPCVGQVDVMFHKRTKAAREVCAGCGYVTECRAEADVAEVGLPVTLVSGVRAGESPAERVARRAVEALEAVPVAVSA